MSRMRRISERFRRRAKKQRCEKSFNKPAASLASGAVRHLDLWLAKANGRGFGKKFVGAVPLSILTPSGSGCSPLPFCGVRSCNTLRMILPMTP